MPYLFEQSGEHEELAVAELKGCAGAAGFFLEESERGSGYLVADTDAPPQVFGRRCGLLWRVVNILYSGPVDSLLSHMEKSVENEEFKGTFAVRAKVKGSADPVRLQREAGGIISKTRGLRVNLSNPDTVFRIFVAGETAYFGPVVAEIDRSPFERRKVQNRPFFSPISIHPKYARVLINLARTPENGRVLDPFCGTGGILIEAGKMGFSPLGSDISQEMIDGSFRNLKSEGVTAELKRCDISSIRDEFGEVDAIATDPPYGRASSTNREEITALYSRMLDAFAETVRMGGYISFVVPDLSVTDRLPAGLSLVESHSLRVHRSLVRHFVLLQKEG